MSNIHPIGDVPACPYCNRFIYGPGHDCDSGLYRIHFMTGAASIAPPQYTVTRRRVGTWPWRRWEYQATCVFSTLTMDEDGYREFRRHFAGEYTEAFGG